MAAAATGGTQEERAGARITLKEIEDQVFKSSLSKVIDKGKSVSGQSKTKIEGFDFTNNSGKDLKMLNVTNCQDVIVRRCRFSGKNLVDVALNVTGANTKRVIIEYCIFENMTSAVSNGGEPIRLGNSQHSGIRFECIVRKCIFRNLNADPETISLKSVGNEVCDNYFINNKSMVTVRHGGLNKIHHNTFEGNNGIRLLGYGNIATLNLHKNNSATDKNSPYQVQYANQAKDPNWTAVNKPSDKEGNSHAIYAQCVDNEITYNEYDNCKNKIFYRKGDPLAPKNLKIVEGKPPSTTPTPTTPPPPTVPNKKLAITAVTASGFEPNSTNKPENVIDGNITTRWSAEGTDQWIQADLGAPKNVEGVGIAWHKGNTRKAKFSVELSKDGTTFTPTTITDILSSGTSESVERYDIPTPTDARYVKVLGKGNTASEWNSILELEVYGKETIPPTPEEEPEQPQPETPTTPQCGICYNESATKKLTLSIYVGANHYQSTRTALTELLKELRADAVTEGGGGGGQPE